jgi:hypothetical protein
VKRHGIVPRTCGSRIPDLKWAAEMENPKHVVQMEAALKVHSIILSPTSSRSVSVVIATYTHTHTHAIEMSSIAVRLDVCRAFKIHAPILQCATERALHFFAHDSFCSAVVESCETKKKFFVTGKQTAVTILVKKKKG